MNEIKLYLIDNNYESNNVKLWKHEKCILKICGYGVSFKSGVCKLANDSFRVLNINYVPGN